MPAYTTRNVIIDLRTPEGTAPSVLQGVKLYIRAIDPGNSGVNLTAPLRADVTGIPNGVDSVVLSEITVTTDSSGSAKLL